jgi:hypothetical protein
MASETVGVRATRATAQSFTTGTTAIMVFDTETQDTHGSYDSATGVFTAPVSGNYRVSSKVQFASGGGWAAGEVAFMDIYLYGTTQYSALSEVRATAAHAERVDLGGTDTVRLLAGQTLAIRLNQGSGASLSTTAAAIYNYISIERVGNY